MNRVVIFYTKRKEVVDKILSKSSEEQILELNKKVHIIRTKEELDAFQGDDDIQYHMSHPTGIALLKLNKEQIIDLTGLGTEKVYYIFIAKENNDEH